MSSNSSKEVATRLGLTQYLGDPCPRGHYGKRFVSNDECVVCNLERTRRTREAARVAAGKPPRIERDPSTFTDPRAIEKARLRAMTDDELVAEYQRRKDLDDPRRRTTKAMLSEITRRRRKALEA